MPGERKRKKNSKNQFPDPLFSPSSACAAVRAFPLFSQKTVLTDISSTVNIEFILIENDSVSAYQLTDNDIECLENAEHAIRLTAKIVDAPCSHMNVSDFVNEIEIIGKALGIVPMVIRGEQLKAKGFGGIYGVGTTQHDSLQLTECSSSHLSDYR